MKSTFSGICASAILLFLTVPLFAQNASVSMEELHECREFAEAETRLACYDRLGSPGAAVQAQTVVSEEALAEEESAYGELADDVGLPNKDDAKKPILVTLTSCGEASNRIFYFKFENGQIWKYIGRKKLKYKNCNPNATLLEDGFGFSLQLDGEAGKLRVQRVK